MIPHTFGYQQILDDMSNAVRNKCPYITANDDEHTSAEHANDELNASLGSQLTKEKDGLYVNPANWLLA
jgi:hypothetical protein